MLRISRCNAGRSIFSRFLTRNISSTENLIEETEPETNFVKLIATTWEDSTKLPTGDQLCKVVQKCHNENGIPFSISHMLTLSKNLLESNNISSLARGQKLNINGYIRSLPFTTSLNKMRRAIAIIPYDIKLYKNDEESPQDVCIVMMTAHIESPIWHQNDLAMFNLRTHVPVKDEEGKFTGESIQHSHTVIAHDAQVRNYLRKHLNRYDEVFIEGHLNYQNIEINDGTNRMSGNIVAVHIEKA